MLVYFLLAFGVSGSADDSWELVHAKDHEDLSMVWSQTELIPISLSSGKVRMLDSRMMDLMESEETDDMFRPAQIPDFTSHFERVMFGAAPLQIKTKLASTHSSTVWTLVDEPRLLVKYNVLDADSIEDEALSEFHPLSREYYIMKSIEHLGISIKVHFLSAATPLPRFRLSSKIDFAMPDTDWEHIFPAPVRFMVMQRGGPSAFNLNVSALDQAVTLVTQMIGILRILHDEANIVHGDTHFGNWVLGSDRRLKLIDFAAARYVQVPNDPLPMYPPREHAMYSPWEMMGFPGTRRDDVFRVILGFVDVLTLGSLSEWYDSLTFAEHYNAKANVNLFVHTPFADLLLPISRLVQGMTNIEQRPPYEEVLALLATINRPEENVPIERPITAAEPNIGQELISNIAPIMIPLEEIQFIRLHYSDYFDSLIIGASDEFRAEFTLVVAGESHAASLTEKGYEKNGVQHESFEALMGSVMSPTKFSSLVLSLVANKLNE